MYLLSTPLNIPLSVSSENKFYLKSAVGVIWREFHEPITAVESLPCTPVSL
jgi:hypothetical protein